MKFHKALCFLLLAMTLVFALPAWAQQKPFLREQISDRVRDGFVVAGAKLIQRPDTEKPSGSESGEFEVASVRVVPENRRGLPSISPPGAAMFTARNVTLAVLIGMAFGVDTSHISGKQLGLEEYDVTAKPQGDGGLTYEQLKPPLQQLLRERFHLTWHYETKSVQGYALVIAKKGPKLHAGTGASARPFIVPGGIRGEDIPMPMLAGMLAIPLRCPVVDKTRLQGNYNIKLDYAPEEATDSSLPSIFTAVKEDLGLKLERQKVQVEMLVIDDVEKTPTEN